LLALSLLLGPAEKEKAFYLMVDEDNNKLHHDLHGRQRSKHRDQLEEWEKAQVCFLYLSFHTCKPVTLRGFS
jgi:hypothetical protein